LSADETAKRHAAMRQCGRDSPAQGSLRGALHLPNEEIPAPRRSPYAPLALTTDAPRRAIIRATPAQDICRMHSQAASAEEFCIPLRTTRGGKPRRRRFILQGTSRHSDGCRCTRIPFREVRRRGWTSSSRGRSAFRCQPTLKATAACAWPRCCGRKRCALPLRASRHVPRRRRAAHGAMSF
jgi:hypothetical protein